MLNYNAVAKSICVAPNQIATRSFLRIVAPIGSASIRLQRLASQSV